MILRQKKTDFGIFSSREGAHEMDPSRQIQNTEYGYPAEYLRADSESVLQTKWIENHQWIWIPMLLSLPLFKEYQMLVV